MQINKTDSPYSFIRLIEGVKDWEKLHDLIKKKKR